MGTDGSSREVCVVESDSRAHFPGAGLLQPRGGPGARQVRVGFTYNLKRSPAGVDEHEAEYESPATVAAVSEALASLGHEVVHLEVTPDLPRQLLHAEVDVVFNMAEGVSGRNREAQVPALLEMLGIPYTGSDPATMAITLDKALAKRVVSQHGVATPDFFVLRTGRERLPSGFTYPAVVKPVAEGSSKGILPSSVVHTEEDLRLAAIALVRRYRQPALAERYLPGREFTVGLLGHGRPRVLPPMEIVFGDPSVQCPVYGFHHKLEWGRELRFEAPARVDAGLRRRLERAARESYLALGCRDLARIDFRLDATGQVGFIECNPLPGLTPGWSDLCTIAASAGMDYRGLISEILAPVLRRWQRGRRVPTRGN